MNIDLMLWLTCSAAETAVIGLLLYRHVWRTLPIFLLYNIWTLTGNALGYAILRAYGAQSSVYVTIYLTNLIVDAILAFAVLIELGWSVLRPIHSSLSRRVLLVIGGLILVLGAAIWPFVSVPGSQDVSRQLSSLWSLDQTISILRVLTFLALAGGSQFLSIGWRDRELQVATGFGFYSMVGVVIAILHTHQTARTQFSLLDRFVVASYLCSLLYWIFSFAQKEAPRRTMTPEVQKFLLAVAGTAHTTRAALASSSSRSNDKQKY